MEYEALFNPRYVAGFIDDCPEADEIIKIIGSENNAIIQTTARKPVSARFDL